MADPQGVQFELHVVGDETGDTFHDKFRAKEKLSWADQLAIDRMRRELLGPLGGEADLNVQQRAQVIAELTFRLTEFPEWWKNAHNGLDLVDDNVVLKVYEEAQRIRKEYLDRMKAKGEEAKKKLGEKQEADGKGKGK